MENSITKQKKWNLIAGGSDPKNDVIPASVGYGLEEGLQFAVSEITRLEQRIKRLEEAGDAMASWAKASPDCHYLFHSDERSLRVNNWIKAKEAKP